jgi:photosystem II stability/assembly factor-like uncharacterized protein
MSSWKKYGGVYNAETVNSISIDNLHANYFSLKNSYVGMLSVSGELLVSQDSTFKSNVAISGNSKTRLDNSIGGNLYVGNNAFISNNLIVNNIDVRGEMTLRGNVKILDNQELESDLRVKGNSIYIGLVDKDLQLYDINLQANRKKLGLNNSNPLYTLDIKSDQINGFNVLSSQSTNNNVIAQNNAGKGVTVTANTTNSSINFFSDSSMQETQLSDGIITYSTGGNITIGASKNTFLNSKVSISNRNQGNHSSSNETLIVYDVSSGRYLPDVYYNDLSFCTGTAISMISNNDHSNTSINIATPSGRGLKIVGGSEITDKTRSSGIIGILDISNNFIPSQTITSGDSYVMKRTTLGINKSAPETDKYVLDINGPMKIGHSEIVMVSTKKFKIVDVKFSNSNKMYGFAYGNRFATDVSLPIKNVILYTHDGGAHWTESIFLQQSSSSFLTTSCIYESDYGFIGGEDGILLYSSDAFVSWKKFESTIVNEKITNINVVLSNGKIIITVAYITLSEPRFGYFLLTSIESINSTTLKNFIFDTPSMSVNLSLSSLKKVNSSVINENYIILVGDGGIAKIDISNNVFNTTLSTLYTHNQNRIYYSIHASKNLIVCVGDGIISSSLNDGLTWSNYTLDGQLLTDVFVYNDKEAVVVGNSGIFRTTNTAGTAWENAGAIIRQSGVGDLILDAQYSLSSVNVTGDNTLIISRQQLTDSSIFYCSFPGLFNKSNNNVLDVSGNMRLSGDISISDNAYMTNIHSDYIRCGNLVADNIDSVNNNILIGTVGGGKTIRISTTSASTEAEPNNIFIGGKNDNVTINGNNVSILGKVATKNTSIQLNSGYTGNTGISAGAGMNIRDFNEDTSGFIRINDQLDGFIFKASTIHPNILNMRVDDMTISNKYDVNSKHRIKNGLVILRDSSSVYNDNNISSNICTMTTASFDVSNIILGNHLF